MPTLELPPADLAELVELELQIARRADELLRTAQNSDAGRDFWHEAEEEIWNSRLREPAATSAA